MTERWTADRCAPELSITAGRRRSYVADPRKARDRGEAHWAPEPLGYDPATGLLMWDAAAVWAGNKSRPGRGARTDLHNTP